MTNYPSFSKPCFGTASRSCARIAIAAKNALAMATAITLFLIPVLSPVAQAQDKTAPAALQTTSAPVTPSEEEAAAAAKKFNALKIDRRLSELDDQIAEREKELTDLRNEIKGIPSDRLGTNMTQELERLQGELSTLRRSFEQIALGGLDISPLKPEPDKPYNWQAELLEVVRPVLASLKDLTDKPRRIESTRQRIAQTEAQINIANEAIKSLTSLQASTEDKDVKAELRRMAHAWGSRRTDFENQVDVARFQLAALQEDRRTNWEIISEALEQFFAGRGLTLAIAFAAAVVVWLIIRLIVLIMRRLKTTSSRKSKRRRDRAMYYSSRLITGLLMILVVLGTFYLRSDVFLLAISILIIAALAIGLRQILPQFYDEIRLLLDFGSVRDGERLLYNGVPMQVREMNAFAILMNPALKGFVRVPLNNLTSMVSRPPADEPWFPCRQGDFVRFSDGGVAQIEEQTVDTVVVRQVGSLRNIRTADFYASSPANLSLDGFSVAVTFGIGYSHQAISLTEVPEKMKHAVEAATASADWGEHCNGVIVEFKEAAASSLDYLIVIKMKGDAASAYFGISRAVQRCLVALCNENDWEIPFAQITVHSANS